ncbi:MAG: GGDEF domain-containing protein [Litorivicinus sp.]
MQSLQAMTTDTQLYLMESLDPESVLARVLNLCAGYVGATLKTRDLPGWHVGDRIAQHEILEVTWQGEDVAELILYGDGDGTRPANLTDLVAMAITYAIRLARAEHAANVDPLTGLANRRAFHQHQHTGEHRVAVLLDLDHFKAVNDTYGHSAGDRVLEHVAKRLKNHLRAGDHAYRWGGEEFLVVLSVQPGDDVMAIADRLRRQISGALALSDRRLSISASAGVAQGDHEMHALIDQADKALYAAKDRGRNRTCQAFIA